MLNYYLGLALLSFRRNKVLTGLMVLTIALGISVSITMLTVLHNLSGNPLPQRSDVLFHPQVDPRPLNIPNADIDPPDDLTYVDALNLYRIGEASRRVLMSTNRMPARLDDLNSSLAMLTTRATTSDFFSMFDVPFIYGSGWSSQDDDRRANVVVLSRALNDRLFGGVNSVGREVEIATRTFRVVGVIDTWNPQPHFYDLNSSAFGDSEQMYLPFFTWFDLPQSYGDYGYGPLRCWGNDPYHDAYNPKNTDCTWVQFWVQLNSPSQVSTYLAALKQYSSEQRQSGRFERAPNVRLLGLLDWLNYKRVIPVTVRMQTWIAFGVLLICIVNTVGLMVVKFLRKSGEIGVRRALGASQREVFVQCFVEAGMVGAAGGLASLPLSWFGLWMVRQQPVNFAASTHLDVVMLIAALALAVFAALCAGLWPAWRASRVTPALQVKSL